MTKTILPEDAAARKTYPLYRGLVRYFPNALAAVAKVSGDGAAQHGHTDIHWDLSKSSDEPDALLRHMLVAEDDMGERAKVAWRALAWLERGLLAQMNAAPAPTPLPADMPVVEAK